jgi:hypothetical protein
MKDLLITIILIFTSVLVIAEESYSANELDQGMLTIYRTADNSAVNYRLSVDGKNIGKLKPNAAINIQLEVGEHVIMSNDRDETKLTVLVDGDNHTYIRKEIDNKTRISLTLDDPTKHVIEQVAARSKTMRMK